jgi:DNA polymerase III delta subunit
MMPCAVAREENNFHAFKASAFEMIRGRPERSIERVDGLNIFHALDALGRGDRKRALFLFRTETEKGEGVYPVLSMCAWQVRRLLLVREAFDKGIRRATDIVSATKLPPFTVQKALSTIEYFPLMRIKNGLTLLSDIDTALKQGKADPETSLDIFVWKF